MLKIKFPSYVHPKEVDETFLAFLQVLIKRQAECHYNKGWIWYRMRDEWLFYDWDQKEISVLACTLQYKPGWIIFKTQQLWEIYLDGNFPEDYRRTGEAERLRSSKRSGQRQQQRKQPSGYQQKVAAACTLLDIPDWPVSEIELRRFYRGASLKHHPDTGGNHEDFIALVAAYEFLCRDIKIA